MTFDKVTLSARPVKVERADHGKHASALAAGTDSTLAAIETKKDSAALSSVFFQVQTAKQTKIRSERHRLAAVGLSLVSPIDETRGIVRATKDAITAFRARLERYATTPSHVGQSQLAFIESVQPADTDSKLHGTESWFAGGTGDCVIRLFTGLSQKERAGALLAIQGFLAEQRFPAVDAVNTSGGLALVRAQIPRRLAQQLAFEFDSVHSISQNAAFFFPDTSGGDTGAPQVTVAPPKGRTIVAVLDGGIDPSNTYVSPLVISTVSCLPPECSMPIYEHGGFVASRVLYGDRVLDEARQGQLNPACRLVDVPIRGRKATGERVDPDQVTIVRAIERVSLEAPEGTRVLNLSLGSRIAIQDGQYSDTAIAIDTAVRKHDLVCVVSAGNKSVQLANSYPNGWLAPESRIDAPSEALLALTVGSRTAVHEPTALAPAGAVSAFSRRGPGADLGIKPELVAHGGNCLPNMIATTVSGALGISDNGSRIVGDCGTSFAAPLVASAAASTFDAYPGCQANLVRALLTHFATEVPTANLTIDPWHLRGFGETDTAKAVFADSHRATFLYQGALRRGVFCHVPFVVPSSMAPRSGIGPMLIRVTVAIDPPVQPEDPYEYACARVTMALGKPDGVGRRPVSLNEQMAPSSEWAPIVHSSRRFTRSYQPGSWDLRLRLWTRGLEEDFEQRFAAVIEVVDLSGKIDLWKDIDDEAGAVFTHPIAATQVA